MTRRVGILVFDEVEVLDACGPFEVFSVASRIAPDVPFEVVLIGSRADQRHVTARGGLRLVLDHTVADAPDLDVLLVPGGVTRAVEDDPTAISWIAARAATPVVASVCTGAFLLAEAGILVAQSVTTHWDDVAELRERFPALTVVEDRRWVGGGALWTSAGISAGLDLSLELVAALESRDLAIRTARQMDYAWRQDPTA